MAGRKFLLILTSIILVSLAVVIWIYPSSEDYREDNPFWNGLSSFTKEFNASPANYSDSLSSTPEKSALFIIPEIEFTNPEMDSVRNYLSLGRTVLILDDYGYGNDILEYLELDVRFTRYPLLDPLFNYKNKWFPKITDFTAAISTENIESIVFNHATSLSNVPEDNVIARSSKFSYLDLNNNSTHDDEDQNGPLPVAASFEVGDGYLVLIADPSILINGMEDIGDNYHFIENILQIKDPDSEILVDQTHVPVASLDEAKTTLSTVRRHLSSPLGISIVSMTVLTLTLNPLWLKKIKLRKKE